MNAKRRGRRKGRGRKHRIWLKKESAKKRRKVWWKVNKKLKLKRKKIFVSKTLVSNIIYGNGRDWWPFGSPASLAQSQSNWITTVAGDEPSFGFRLSWSRCHKWVKLNRKTKAKNNKKVFSKYFQMKSPFTDGIACITTLPRLHSITF